MAHLRHYVRYALFSITLALLFGSARGQPLLGPELLVEARGAGGVLWTRSFRIADTSVGDVKEHHLSEMYDVYPPVATSSSSGPCSSRQWPQESLFTENQVRLLAFEDADGQVEIQFDQRPFLDEDSGLLVDSALLEDDAESLESAAHRAARRTLSTSGGGRGSSSSGEAPIQVTKLSVVIVKIPGCFSEKGWGVVHTLLGRTASPGSHGLVGPSRGDEVVADPAALAEGISSMPSACTYLGVGLLGAAIGTWSRMLTALDQRWSDAEAAVVHSVAALFFPKQGLRAPWAPSWEVAFAEWEKSKPLFREFRAQVTRMQYFRHSGDVAADENYFFDDISHNVDRLRLVRREVVVEKSVSRKMPWLAKDPQPWTRWEKHLLVDGRGRYTSRTVEPPNGIHGLDLDSDPPDLVSDVTNPHPAELRPQPSAALQGAKWFGLPEGREPGGPESSFDWLPVGEPRLFRSVNMATFLDTVMLKELQIHFAPESGEGFVQWGDEGRLLSRTLAAAVRKFLPVVRSTGRDQIHDDAELPRRRSWGHGAEEIQTTTVPDYSNNRDEFRYNWHTAAPADYVLVHFARNSDADLFAEYTVAADRRKGIFWRLRLFRPSWAATTVLDHKVVVGRSPQPQLMQDNEVAVTNGSGLAWIPEHDDLVIGSPEALFVSLVMQAAHYEAVRWFLELVFEGSSPQEAPSVTKVAEAERKVQKWLAEQADALDCYSKKWRDYTREDVDAGYKDPSRIPSRAQPAGFTRKDTDQWKKLFATYDVKLCIDDAGIKLCLPRWTLHTGFAQDILKRALGFVGLCFKHNELFVAPDKFKLLPGYLAIPGAGKNEDGINVSRGLQLTRNPPDCQI
eukprot:g14418.t1